MLCYCLFHLLKDLKFGDNNSDNNSSIVVMGSYVYFVLQLMPSEHKNDNTWSVIIFYHACYSMGHYDRS